MSEQRYVLGKVDYNGDGRDNCEAAITWTLKDGRFSMQAEIWQPNKRDILTGGQCVDTVAAFFPNDEKAQRMLTIWERWHLNDMRAGTPEQEALLKAHRDEYEGYPTSHYEWACQLLKAHDLYEVDGYKYGRAWLTEPLPKEVITEIESWSE